jgi:hypothetical protein
MIAAAAGVLAGCTQAPPAAQGVQANQRLQAILAGKVAGAPRDCIPPTQAGSPSVVTPTEVAYEVNPGLVYVSSVAGSGCENASDPTYASVTRSNGPGLCSGDRLEIHDPHTRVLIGACTLGPFTPYSAR